MFMLAILYTKGSWLLESMSNVKILLQNATIYWYMLSTFMQL